MTPHYPVSTGWKAKVAVAVEFAVMAWIIYVGLWAFGLLRGMPGDLTSDLGSAAVVCVMMLVRRVRRRRLAASLGAPPQPSLHMQLRSLGVVSGSCFAVVVLWSSTTAGSVSGANMAAAPEMQLAYPGSNVSVPDHGADGFLSNSMATQTLTSTATADEVEVWYQAQLDPSWGQPTVCTHDDALDLTWRRTTNWTNHYFFVVPETFPVNEHLVVTVNGSLPGARHCPSSGYFATYIPRPVAHGTLAVFIDAAKR